MIDTLQDLKKAAALLNGAERAEFARFLLDTLEGDGDPEEVRSEWLLLAEDRMADVKAGNVIGIPAEEVFREPPDRST